MKKKVEKFRVANVQILKRTSTAKKCLKRFRPGATPAPLNTRHTGAAFHFEVCPVAHKPPLWPGGEEDKEKRSRLLLLVVARPLTEGVGGRTAVINVEAAPTQEYLPAALHLS